MLAILLNPFKATLIARSAKAESTDEDSSILQKAKSVAIIEKLEMFTKLQRINLIL